jgi:crossover junction endodeoxyribonuclease RuvC
VRILGLDLKPARSGIASNYDAATGEHRLSVTAAGTALIPIHEQVRELERAVFVRIRDHAPDVVFIEGTFSRGSQSDYGQHAAHFAVTHLLWARGIPWVDVQTGLVKIWATGSGSQRGATKVTKDKVIAAILATYGRLMSIPPLDDECDAVSLLTMCLAAYGRPLVDLPKEQTRALKSLVKNGPLPPLRRAVI